MAGEEQTVNQQKAPKLRSACNQCNTAKVKCSGERQGCKRCVCIQVDCIYTESRVGKVQGIRTKRKKTLIDNTTPGTSRSDTNGAQTESCIEGHALSLLEGLHSYSSERWTAGSWDDEMLAFDTPIEMFNGVFDENATSSMNNSETGDAIDIVASSEGSVSTFTTSMSESGRSRPEYQSVHQLGISPSPATTIDPPPLLSPISLASATPLASMHTTTTHPQKPTYQSPMISRKADSKCVLACSHMIVTLENYLLSELKVLDLILSTVRTVTAELNRLIQYQQKSGSERCMLLFITIMHQIIELLEAGSKPGFEGTENEDTGVGMMAGSQGGFVPQFGFSAFSVNSEEQRSWRAHIIRKEYENTGDTLTRIVAVVKLGFNGALDSPEAIDPNSKCLVGLERRLRILQEKVQ